MNYIYHITLLLLLLYNYCLFNMKTKIGIHMSYDRVSDYVYY